PVANWICLAFMAMILVILAFTPGLSVSVWLVPVWLVVMWLGHAAKRRSNAAAAPTEAGGR
ncbi:MAG: aromatic amino acid transporter AroP, partial [Trinickia sp.]